MISFASLLKRQNPLPAYGHGWIMGKDGKRWHPSNDQKALLRGLSKKPVPLLRRILRIGG
ncbi:phage filamentation protein Fil family protein [Pantoea sp. FN060301]|uniref:phage filamentation protein Fil family protein n=1 Tax=Pantoea sp. FN060301 TaxID=3420380 RepID=UPI003D16AD11